MRIMILTFVILFNISCSQTSDLAIQGIVESERIQDAVNNRLDEGLRIYMYRDMRSGIEKMLARELTEDESTWLSNIWNDRDQLTLWQVQYERARALRMMTADAKIYADQHVFTLLGYQMKYILNKTKGAYDAVADYSKDTNDH